MAGLPRSSPSRTPRVVVIGAGVGGLAAAALLARQGLDVRVFEAAGSVGGKLGEVAIGPLRLDAGPTVLTMRWVFDELFDALGESFEAALAPRRCEVLARHAWGADRLDLLAGLDDSVDAIAALAGGAEAGRYRGFCDRAQAVYRTLERPFLRSPRPDPLSLAMRVGPGRLPELLAIAPFRTLWDELGRHFHDPRLRQLFGRYATYCGSSPFAAPATLMLVAHVEREAVWQLDGGMRRLALALADAARRHGARIACGRAVQSLRLDGGRVAGVRLEGGEEIAADVVVHNGDARALHDGLLGAGVQAALGTAPALPRSLSAVTWHLQARAEGFALSHHNVFFSEPGDDGYRREFDALAAGRLPASPTVYVCAQDRSAGAAAPAPDGPERLMCLVNAPALGTAGAVLGAEEIDTCERRMRAQLARAGLTLSMDAPAPVRTTPADFARRYPGSAGALYGAASHGWRASFQRPANRSPLPGLYLAGGSAHPGPGVPMAALSGRLAVQQILSDLASTRPSRPAATPGGMPTR